MRYLLLALRRPLPACLVAVICGGLLVAVASGQMRSRQLDSGICATTGGGKFVKIPGFPGEMIDRRILPDVEYFIKKYHLYVTDGYSMDPVHAANGEHPLGLAIDVVPDKANGGSWRLVTELANIVEPRQNHPIAPFRWVGYNGDAGHGRGNHLHISWNHNTNTTPGEPARTVYTERCPDGSGTSGTSDPSQPPPPSGGTGAGDGTETGTGGGVSADAYAHHRHHHHRHHNRTTRSATSAPAYPTVDAASLPNDE